MKNQKPAPKVYANHLEYVLETLSQKVLNAPLKKGWEKTVLKDYVPAEHRKNFEQEFVDMFVDRIQINFNIEIKAKSRKEWTLDKLVELILKDLKNGARYGRRK